MAIQLLQTWSVLHYDREGARTHSQYGLTRADAEAIAAKGARSYARQERDTGDRPILDFALRVGPARAVKRKNQPPGEKANVLFE